MPENNDPAAADTESPDDITVPSDERPSSGPNGAPPRKDSPADAPGKTARGGPMLGILALLLALAALVLAALAWMQHDAGDIDQHEALAGRVTELAGAGDALAERVREQAATRERLERRLDAVEALPLDDLAARPWESVETEVLAALDELERRTGRELAAYRSRLDELGATDTDLDRQMQMLEAQALLRMAQDRLELADDRRGALHALRRAAARLDAQDEPRLGAARRELAREIEVVAAWQPPDWPALTGRVRGLAEQVAHWPLHTRAEASEMMGDGDAAADGRLGRIGAALKRLVTIRRTDEFTLRPDQVDALRQELRERLRAMEMALAHWDEALLQDQANALTALLQDHFDTGDARVARALESLREVVVAAAVTDRPGLGGALRRLESLEPAGG